LGAMAAVVAHEVKNPLAGIAGAIQIIGKKLPEGSRERAIVGDMLERISALNETIRDILGFARPQPPRTQSVKVLDLVNNTVSLFLKDPKLSGLNVRVEGDGALVSADPALLEQDLLNILINAAQAMSYEGTIRVSIGADSEQCALTIHDSGPGIPADIRAQVFEPFFTTKGRGTGLGLPTAKRHIEAQGGTIDIECPPSGGTKVTICLPLAAAG
ncbi:MAG: ATP-binding protein, partial [Planctomycetes bacterium]|nr:ATP-binding protein [Planctomycetota bacterium]